MELSKSPGMCIENRIGGKTSVKFDLYFFKREFPFYRELKIVSKTKC